jgi:hypothetical protein
MWTIPPSARRGSPTAEFGGRPDNQGANLRLLCPDCHAQTDTYCGRNIGRR